MAMMSSEHLSMTDVACSSHLMISFSADHRNGFHFKIPELGDQ